MQPETDNYSSPGEHLFTEEDVVTYEHASTGQRFGNLLIDTILLSYGLSFVTGYLLAMLLVQVAPDFIYEVANETDRLSTLLFSYIVGIFNYLVYYTICEKAFRGYTLGKLITGTRAIRNDGGELTLKDAFLRTLSRIVPFEAFSGLNGLPWHDTWTKTTVIRTR